MAEKRGCDECGKDYWWPRAGWQHELKDGFYRCTGKPGRVVPVEDIRKAEPSVVVGAGEPGKLESKQRWSREAYNAYQREYMRKWRAKKGGL